jgi:hypothetical protein
MVRQVLRASLAAILAAFACVTVNLSPVHAAGGLTLSPTLKDITLGPGLLETTSEVVLTNNTAQTVRAKLKLVDLKALGEFGGTSLQQAGLPDSYNLANWMSLPGGDSVTINANQTVTVKVAIANRPDLTPGGHYGAVIVSADSEGVKGNVNISQQVVSLLFVKKLGGEKYGLDLKEMLLDQAGGRLPQSAKLSFTSTGNVHAVPRGYVAVTDPKGKLVAKGIINPDSLLVLPGGSRQFITTLQTVANSRTSGQYKVTAYFRYDGTDTFQTQSIYFTRAGTSPAALVATALGALVLLTLTVYVVRRYMRRPKK